MKHDTHRAREILSAFTHVYPDAWNKVEQIRARRGIDFSWPNWCYLSVTEALSLIREADGKIFLEKASHIPILSALAAWRMGQQIIRYDSTLYKSLIETPITGALPTSLFYNLPLVFVY